MEREKERREHRALYCELFERVCAPGPMVLAVEVVPSERAKGRIGERRERESERIRGGRQDQEEGDEIG